MNPIVKVSPLEAEFQRFFASASRAKLLVLHTLLGLLEWRSDRKFQNTALSLIAQVGIWVEKFDGREETTNFISIMDAMLAFSDLGEEEAAQIRAYLKLISQFLFPFPDTAPPPLEDYLLAVFKARTAGVPDDAVLDAFTVLPGPVAAVLVLTNAVAPEIDVTLTGDFHFPAVVVTASIREYYERIGYRTEISDRVTSWKSPDVHVGRVDIFDGTTLKMDAFYTAGYSAQHLLSITINRH
jgi:hypothetical protein